MKKIIKDIKNGTSYSVDYLISDKICDTLSVRGIKIRKIFSPLLRLIYKTQTSYKLIKDNSPKKIVTNKGKIFVVNHRQADDIVLGANAIGESGYIVFGNKTLVLETTNGLGLWAYGVIVLDRDNEQSRTSTYDKMKFVLENGGNVIIYPEGYWNLSDDGLGDERHLADDHNSENWLIQDINIGAVRLAQETGCPIIPTVLHYDEVKKKRCYSSKGDAIYVSREDDIFNKKDEVVQSMTDMYFYLMEKYSTYSRQFLESNGQTLKEQWEILKRQLIADCDIDRIGYKLDLADEKLIGKAKVVKHITTNEDAFEHLNDIEVKSETAFLLSKRLSGKRR